MCGLGYSRQQSFSKLVEAWSSPARGEDPVRVRQKHLTRRIHRNAVSSAVKVIQKTLDLLKYRRWRRWLLAWSVCLIGGIKEDRTNDAMDLLTAFIKNNDWRKDNCDVSYTEFPLLNPDSLQGQQHLFHQGPRPPDRPCSACVHLDEFKRHLHDQSWPSEVENRLNASPHQGRLDLGGILWKIGALEPLQKHSIEEAADALFKVLHHLYPGWCEARKELWQMWQEAEERFSRREENRLPSW